MKKLLLLAVSMLLTSSLFAQITVNATVPAGTPSCYFYGEMSGNSFVAMTPAGTNKFTITFPSATSIGWGYKFSWSGEWAAENLLPAGDIKEEPVDGVINITIEEWKTSPSVTYEYTTYTNWQLKGNWEDAPWEWKTLTMVSEGVFSISDVSYADEISGFNLLSDDGPVKKDWYPLSDISVDDNVEPGKSMTVTLTVLSDDAVSIKVTAIISSADEAQANAAEVVGIYNMIGQPVSAQTPGLKIFVYSNGTTEKKY